MTHETEVFEARRLDGTLTLALARCADPACRWSTSGTDLGAVRDAAYAHERGEAEDPARALAQHLYEDEDVDAFQVLRARRLLASLAGEGWELSRRV